VTGLVAAFGCYALYKSYRRSTLPTLHRSNAVYRRRRLTRAQQDQTNNAEGGVATPNNVDHNGTRQYGLIQLEDSRGTVHTRPLTLSNVMSLDALRTAFQVPDIEVDDARLQDWQYRFAIHWVVRNLPEGAPSVDVNNELRRLGLPLDTIARITTQLQTDGLRSFAAMVSRETAVTGAHDDADTVAGTELSRSHSPAVPGSTVGGRDGHNLKQMLYYIAEDQSRTEGYVHRSVKCNQCDTKPIRGIRWRCANCADYDLCSDCEAQSMHDKTHIFYKVKIPAPFLGNPRQAQPVAYPGKPQLMPRTLNNEFRQRIIKETEFELHEIDALYDQFTCLANRQWDADPNQLGAAIDRKAFDKTFVPLSSVNPPRPNLIYDRMFSFYDTNSDSLIGFEEFIKGLAVLYMKIKGVNRLRKVFEGYDIDNDGFVSRKDFLRMFRAYYMIQKDIMRDLLAVQQADEDLTISGATDIIASSQPLSSAFETAIPPSDRRSSATLIKPANTFGDQRHATTPMCKSGEDQIDRSEVIGNSWEHSHRFPFDQFTGDPVSELGMAIDVKTDSGEIIRRDVEFSHNGRPVSLLREDAVMERWRRRQFYTDEEEGFVAPDSFEPGLNGIHDSPQFNDEAGIDDLEHNVVVASPSLRQTPEGSGHVSPRSRSSSKVRFQEEVEFETRSNASTSSRPINERFGGYEIPEAEKDLGKDILYQVTEQAINELLDPLFKEKEDLAMDVHVTKIERRKWKKEIATFVQRRHDEQNRAAMEAADPLLATAAATSEASKGKSEFSKNLGEAVSDIEKRVQGQTLDELLHQSGYSVIEDFEADIRIQRSLTPSPEQNSESIPLPNGFLHGSEASTSNQIPCETIYDKDRPNVTSNIHNPAIGDEEKENLDPTLPQMRPNSPRSLASSQPSQSHKDERMSEHEQENAMSAIRRTLEERFEFSVLGSELKLDLANSSLQSPDGRIRVDIPSSETNAKKQSSLDEPPSEDRLEYLARINEIDHEIAVRGGPGRLDYEEFERFMTDESGHRFVEAWLELGSF
jgi:Ca2+-binding EF-hand superfamily protein